MTRRIKAIFTCVLATIVIWGVLTAAGHLMISYNNRRLRQTLMLLDVETVTLNDVVPFGWDTVYTFDPYLSKEEMEKIIGFKSSALRETVSEGMVSLVFVSGRTVVSSVCGYSSTLGYSVRFSTGGGHFSKLSVTDDAVFSIEKSGGVVRLVYIANDAQHELLAPVQAAKGQSACGATGIAAVRLLYGYFDA